MKKPRISDNPNATKEKIFEQIKKYGPVTAKAVSSALEITSYRVQQAVSYLRNKNKVNIQKKGKRYELEYFFDPEFPVLGAPSLTEQAEEQEGDDLFDELNGEGEQLAPMYPARSEPSLKGLDLLVDRCHHLIMALELCSSCAIQDSFNLDENQSRILVNKVAAKYSDITISFSVKLKKGDNNGS